MGGYGKVQKIADCPFFNNFPLHAASYKFVYCDGPKMESCVRLSYKEKNGVRPPENLAPTGVLVEPEK